MSDSDDDNIVRYGTQLEPFEEDRSRAMPKMKKKKPNSARKRFRKLRELNINFHKAEELCWLPWPEIFKIVPAIKPIIMEMLNPSKKKKNDVLTVKSRQELQQTEECSEEPDQRPFWHDPGDLHTSPDGSRDWGLSHHNKQSYIPNEYDMGQGSFSHQPDRPPQNSKKISHTSHRDHWEQAGPSHGGGSQTNRRTRRPIERGSNRELPPRFGNASRVDRGESNRERDRSPFTRNRSPRMGDHSSRMRNRSPGMRDRSPRMRDHSPRMRDRSPRMRDRSPRMRDRSPRMRDHSPGMRDRSPITRNYSSRPRDYSPSIRSQHDPIPMACSSRDWYQRAQLINSDEALQLDVENRIQALKHFYEKEKEKGFSGQPQKTQKTSSDGAPSFIYGSEPDRPSRLGLRNETHPIRASTYSYSEDKKFREDPKNYQKIIWDNNVNQNSTESDRPSRDGLRNQTHPVETISIEDSDDEYSGPLYEPHTPDDGNAQFDFSEAYRTEPKSEEFYWKPPSGTLELCESKDAIADKKARPILVYIRDTTRMTEAKMKLLHQSINQAIVQIRVQGAGPKFSRSRYQRGGIVMICENHESRIWLEKNVPTLKPWPEASLTVMLYSKPIRMTLLIPEQEGIEPSTALELLRVQNPGLNTVHWKIYRVTAMHCGQIVYVLVDKASFEVLKLNKFKVNLGMTKVSMRLLPKRGGKRLEKGPLASTKKQNKVPNPCAVESNTSAVAENSSRVSRKLRRAALKKSIDTKPSLLAQIKESKSPPAKTWTPNADQSLVLDQSYASSDWTTW